MTVSDEGFLRGDGFEAVLAILCCYDYGANSSETAEKIATDHCGSQWKWDRNLQGFQW